MDFHPLFPEGVTYRHTYRDKVVVETLLFPVGWLNEHGLEYRDGILYKDGVEFDWEHEL